MDKLKPCPFCGYTVVQKGRQYDKDNWTATLTCCSCHAEFKLFGNTDTEKDIDLQILQNWNMRASKAIEGEPIRLQITKEVFEEILKKRGMQIEVVV